MADFERYAIYYLPPEGGLAQFGAKWLGWDALTGQPCAHPQIDDPEVDIAALTATPRKYGFHGTIKPPFRLADGRTFRELETEFVALCAALRPFEMPGLQLSQLGSFLALTPDGDASKLSALASATVQALDPFRAPASDAELARRRSKGLTPRQDTYLTQWGYPYVLEEFRFHMTLSGSIRDEALLVRTRDVIAPLVSPHLPVPFRFDALSLVGSDETGRFKLITRRKLCDPGA